MTANPTLRPLLLDDIPELARLCDLSREVDVGAEHRTLDQLTRRFTAPGVALDNCFVAVEPGVVGCGEVAGYGEVLDFEYPGWGFGQCLVAPAWRLRGLGRALLRAADERFLERHSALPADRPVFVWRRTADTIPAASRLFESEGYRLIRTGYTMVRDLSAQSSSPVPLPPGLVYRAFDWDRDLAPVHAAIQEAFRDQFGHAEDTPLETWRKVFSLPEYADRSLWLVAMDGEEVAGALIGARSVAAVEPEDWVDHLGVRPRWRHKGLAKAMLEEVFRRFHEKGSRQVVLGVDAENSSGALELYRRVGMRIHRVHLTYQKTLRGPEARFVRDQPASEGR